MKERFHIAVVLDKIYTLTSGDVLDQGEWYVKVNSGRYPTEGIIKLSKNETYIPPDPHPTVYSTIVDRSSNPFDIKIQIKEEDTIKDDLMLEAKLKLPFTDAKDSHVFKSTDGKVTAHFTVVVVKCNSA
eukprot:TRINITY_DN592_c0_g1_i1.p1 TRINITY_DN592_c0_g1~~TRINITY_DN592_c0_g1_i1.p1  ORF type:complete len:129 (+),score=35.17 TRINITY_DN592_c0_g1_i1:131-517(+)